MKPIYYHDFGAKYRLTPNKYLIDEVGKFPMLMGKCFKFFWFYIYWEKYSFWFKLFGYGISGKGLSKTWRLFLSKKNSYKKMYNYFGWKFEFLKPK